MKFLNSLDILGSGGTLLDVQGSQGQLFSVTDSLSGSIFAVSDISGVPILDVNSSGTSYFSGNVGIGTAAPGAPLQINRSSNGINQYIYNTTSGQAYIAFGNATTGLFSQDFTSANGLLVGIDQDETAIIWNAEATRLRFGTSGTERMSIAAAGNVGIGTTAPATKLHIQEGNTNILIGSDDTYGQNYSAIGFGGLSNGSNRIFAGYDGSSIYDDMYYAAGTGKGHQFRVNGAGSTSMIITSGGNVGIGTTAPGAKLDVVGEIFASSNVQISATGAVGKYYIRRPSDGSASAFFGYNSTDNTDFGVYNGSGGGNVKFWSNNGIFQFNNLASSELMRITSGGNVGIGTTSPSYGLDVNHNAARIGSSSQTTTSLYLTATNTAGAPAVATEIIMQGYEGRAKGTFYTDSGVDGEWFNGVPYNGNHNYWQVGFDETGGQAEYQANSILTVRDNGNVGIGTTAPLNSLDVYRATGDASIRIQAETAADSTILKFRNSNADADITVDYTTSNQARMVFNTDNSGGYVPVLSLEANRDTLMYGNVGIGTTSPNAKLNVKSSDSTADQITLTHSGNTVNIVAIGQESSHGSLFLRANSGVNKVRLSAAGNNSYILDSNVGIGTTSPNTALQVNQNTTVPLLIHRPSNTSFDPHGIGFSTRNDTANGGLGDVRSGIFSDYNGDLFLAAATSSITTSPLVSSRLFIEGSNGNVGIGTTSPGSAFKLDVNGYIKANSRIYVRDSTKTIEIGTDYIQSYVTSGTAVNPIRFFTGSTEKARINGDGNVGIGTTAPTIKFQAVQTTADWVGGFKNYATGAFGLRVDLSGSSGANAAFQVYTATGGGMLVKNNGKVGIGTTSPSSKLDVNGDISITVPNTNTSLLLKRDVSGTVYTYGSFNNAGSDFNINGTGNVFINADSNSDSTSPDRNVTIGNRGVEYMRVTGSGNVGIGTTAPGAKLDVSDSSLQNGNTPGIKLSNSHNAQTVLLIENTTSRKYEVSVGGSANSIGNGSFYIYDVTAGDTRLVINSSGNVGIGATNPQSKLQVAGGIQMAGDTAAASAAKVGTMRYRTGTEYVEVDGANLDVLPTVGGTPDAYLLGAYGTNTATYSNQISTLTFVDNSGGGYHYFNTTTNMSSAAVVNSYYTAKITFKVNTGAIQWHLYTGSAYINSEVSSGTGYQTMEITFQAASASNIFIKTRNMSAGQVIDISLCEIFEVTEEDASYADMCMQTGSSTYEWVNIVRNTY